MTTSRIGLARSTRCAFRLVVAASLVLAPVWQPAQSAAVTWTGTASTNWSGGGPGGNWNGAAAPTSGDSVVFDSLSTANLGTNNDLPGLSLGGITVQNPTGAVSIGGNSFTVGAGGIDMSVATQNLTISPAVTFTGTQTLNIASPRILTLSAAPTLQEGADVTKDGSGQMTVGTRWDFTAANNTFRVASGILQCPDIRFGQGAGKVSTVYHTGGTINAPSLFIVGGTSSHDTGKGVYYISGTAVLNTGQLYVAWYNDGEINQTGGQITCTRIDSATNGGNGVYNLSGGTLTVSGNANLGYNGGMTTTVTQTGGNASFGGLNLGGIGSGGTAYYTINDTVGASTLTVGNTGLKVGATGTGKGYLNIDGGTTLVHGDMYVGALTATSGTVTQTDGTVTIDADKTLYFRSTTATGATYNLNGGTLTLAHIDYTNAATQHFNFGGGTLKANGNLNTTMPMTVNAGGGTIDTQAYTTTFSGAFSVSGDLTKKGTGTLNLNGSVSAAADSSIIADEGTIVFGSSVSTGAHRLTIAGAGVVEKTGEVSIASGGELVKDGTGTLTINATQTVAGGERYTHVDGTLNATNFYVGYSGVADVVQTGGTVNIAQHYLIVGVTGGLGRYTISDGLLDLTAATGNGRIYCAWTGDAEINQSGGTVMAKAFDSATDGGNGAYNLSGGQLIVTGVATMGYGAAKTTTFTQTGGDASFGTLEIGGIRGGDTGTGNYTINTTAGPSTLTVGSGGMIVGYNDVGNFYVDGGTVNVNGNFFVGYNATATGTVTQTAGQVSVDPSYALRFGNGTSATGTYNLNGGTLTLANIAFANPATQHFNFDGGTLQANGNLNTSMPMTANAGGGTVDTNGNGVTLGGDLTTSGTLTKVGTGVLTVSGSVNLNGDAGFVCDNDKIVLSGAVNVGTHQLTIDGAGDVEKTGSFTIASGGELLKTGSGTLVLAGQNLGGGATYTHQDGMLDTNDFRLGYGGTATVQQSGGTIDAQTYFIVGGGTAAGSKGVYNLSGGQLDVHGRLYCAWQADGEINQTGGTVTAAELDSATDGGHGVYNLRAGTLTVTGNANLGYNAGYTTDFTQSGGNASFGGLNLAGIGTGGTGNYTINTDDGAAQLTVGAAGLVVGYKGSGVGNFYVDGGTVQVNGNLYVGHETGATGTVIQTDGNVTVAPGFELRLANSPSATGTYELQGGTLNTPDFRMGYGNGSTGTVTQSGGTANVTNYLILGAGGTGTGTYNMDGGSLNIVNYDLYLGWGDTSSGTVNQTAGTVTIGTRLLYHGLGGGTYNLDGGTLVLHRMEKMAAVSTSDVHFNFGGGTLQADGALSTTLPITVTGGGGTVDTNGNGVTLGGDLTTSGTLTKIGTGVLTVSGSVNLAGDAGFVCDNDKIVLSGAVNVGTHQLTIDGAGDVEKTGSFTIASGGELLKTGSGTLVLAGQNLGGGATYTHQDGMLDTNDFRLGYGGTATVQQSGGTIDAQTYFIVGGGTAAGSKGVYNLSGGQLDVHGRLYCAWQADGEINQTGGTVTTANLDSATDGGHGVYNLHGGSLTVNGIANLGYKYTTDFIQSGGTASFGELNLGGRAGAGTANYTINTDDGASQMTIRAGGVLNVGYGNNGTGSLDVDGGTVTVNADVYLGLNGNAHGTVTQTGGTLTIDPAHALRFRSTGAFNGTYDLNGGTLTLAAIDYTNAATQHFNFGGGTLRANGALTTDMPMTVNAGGATVDTNGHTVTFNNGNLGGPGGLTKAGDGDLVLNGAHTFGGDALVIAGRLLVEGSISGNATVDGGILGGGGLIGGDVLIESGKISAGSSPGTIYVGGNYDQDDTMLIEIEGYTQGVEYDFIDVTGAATVRGILEMVLDPGVPIEVGDAFDVLTAGGGVSIDGPLGFENTGAPLGPALFWKYALVDNDHTLQVSLGVPEPASAALLVLGGLVLLLLARRRRLRVSR